MPFTAEQFFAFLGQFGLTVSTAALAAFGVFRFLGKSWIENQLSKDLEAAKAQLALTSARRLKLHDREYEVFPTVWQKLSVAVSRLATVVAGMRMHPDFSRMSDDDLAQWMERTGFDEEEKRAFLSDKDKNNAYRHIMEWRDLKAARLAFLDFHEYLQANRIFLSPEFKGRFDKIDDNLNSAWVAKQMDWEGFKKEGFGREAYSLYSKEIKPLMKEIEELVQSKIFHA